MNYLFVSITNNWNCRPNIEAKFWQGISLPEKRKIVSEESSSDVEVFGIFISPRFRDRILLVIAGYRLGSGELKYIKLLTNEMELDLKRNMYVDYFFPSSEYGENVSAAAFILPGFLKFHRLKGLTEYMAAPPWNRKFGFFSN